MMRLMKGRMYEEEADGKLVGAREEEEEERLRLRVARLGCHTLLKMVIKDNFIHADLHPGNLLVSLEELPWWHPSQLWGSEIRPKLVLLDAGMVMELSTTYKEHIVDFFKAIADMDGTKVATELLKFSDKGCEAPDFVSDMGEVFSQMRLMHEAGKIVTDGVSECLDTVRRHQVRVSTELLAVVTTALVLEGWSSHLDPELRILNVLKDLLETAEKIQGRIVQRLMGKLQDMNTMDGLA
uniref:ABC1 atypical kinase-like domain-containing protein n=1 Tax=Pyramimonas obovata TaxID=1411642 RepID=A0A7S0QZ96_9CHLO